MSLARGIRFLLTAIIILAASSFARLNAQNVNIRYDNILWTSSYVAGQAVLIPVSNAQVQICTYPANAVPCTNLASLYYGPTTASGTSSNPVTSDQYGNFGFWAPAGYYQYTITNSFGQAVGPFSLVLAGTASSGTTIPVTTLVLKGANAANVAAAAIPGTDYLIPGALPNSTTATTQSPGDSTNKLATDAFVQSAYIAAIPATSSLLAGSGLSGSAVGVTSIPNGVTATTQSLGDDTTKIATDAFVIANTGGGGGFPITIGSTSIASGSTTTSISGLTLVAPALGTPTALTLTNATGLPWSGITGSPSTTQVPFQSLTTTGSSGPATLSGGVLNVPQYTGGGGGLPSGTQGYPLINNAGSTGYSTSAVFIDASQFSGSDPSIKVNACITAAIAIGGVCDARALGVEPVDPGSGIAAAVVTSEQINVGDSNGHPVTLLLPASFYWVGGMTDGTSCTLAQYANTSIISAGGTPNGNSSVFGASNTSNLGYVYCYKGINSAEAQNYVYDFGFSIMNYTGFGQGHATANGIGSYILGPIFDEATWDHVDFGDSYDAIDLELAGACCNTRFVAGAIDAEAGGTPLVVLSNSSVDSGLQSIDSVLFEDETINGNGPGLPAILVQDTGNNTSAIAFKNIYSEVHYAPTAGVYQFSGVGNVQLDNINIRAEGALGSGPGIGISNVSPTVITATNLNFTVGGGSWSSLITAIANSYTGASIPAFRGTNTWQMPFYSNNPIPAASFGSTGQLSVATTGAITNSSTYNSLGIFSVSGGQSYGSPSTAPSWSGSYNLAITSSALSALTSGSRNIAIGRAACGNDVTTQNDNTCIGVTAGENYATTEATLVGSSANCNGTYTNCGAFGYNSTATASNQYAFGNTSVTQNLFSGSLTGFPSATATAASNLLHQAGQNTSTGQQGWANIQQSFTLAAPLSSTFQSVSMTTTADQVTASPTTSVTNVGIAQSTGTGYLVSGTYTSGITATGSATQTCTLTSFNDSSTATATVALTGTNTIAGGTAIVVTSQGTGATAAPTSATAGNGTATCSGTATLSTVVTFPVYVVSHGKTTVRFDASSPTVGDVACYPLSGGTTGLAHDNGTTACTLGEGMGVITGQVSGALATVEVK